jgi:hypothetical protein
MKLSLDARRTRQRLGIRVPASPPSFVNVLQTGSFGILGAFRGKFVVTFLLPIKEGFPVTRPAIGGILFHRPLAQMSALDI